MKTKGETEQAESYETPIAATPKLLPKWAQILFVTVLWAYVLGIIWVAYHNYSVTVGSPPNTGPQTDPNKEAIQHIEAALQAKPDDADMLNNLGVLLFAQGDVAGAITNFQRAVSLDPQNDGIRRNLLRAQAH